MNISTGLAAVFVRAQANFVRFGRKLAVRSAMYFFVVSCGAVLVSSCKCRGLEVNVYTVYLIVSDPERRCQQKASLAQGWRDDDYRTNRFVPAV